MTISRSGNLDALESLFFDTRYIIEDVLQDVIGGIDVNKQMRVDIFTKNNVWRKSVPVLTIDNRFVPRWRSSAVPAQEVFEQIIQSVGGESK